MNWDLSRPRESMDELTGIYPEMVRYFEGWGRRGDDGYIVEEEGRSVGAAWFRLFSAEASGFGFVDEEAPEFSIALVPEARGRGIGTSLLSALLDLARDMGFPRISLSVAIANPARRLYERFGFVKVRDDADGYQTMFMDLDPA